MRPIQWHLQNHSRTPESLEKVFLIPRSLRPAFKMVAPRGKCQPLHPVSHAVQILTDASKEGWDTQEISRQEGLCPCQKASRINYLELKAIKDKKEFQDRCSNKMVLIATDNTTAVAYINKEKGMRLGLLCAILWRILTWCSRKPGTLKAWHFPVWLNVVEDKISRLGQIIQREWSLLPEVFQLICTRWHQPQIDLFAVMFNNKLPYFVLPVSDSLAWAVDALSLPWEDLDPYVVPPVAILGKVVEKLRDYSCRRIIVIALAWPNILWFWDLVAMSSQIPLFLPNLLTQPFNQTTHRNLPNLNLLASLLEPPWSRLLWGSGITKCGSWKSLNQISLWSVVVHPVKLQVVWQRHLRVRVRKCNFKMVAILFFQMTTISKAS